MPAYCPGLPAHPDLEPAGYEGRRCHRKGNADLSYRFSFISRVVCSDCWSAVAKRCKAAQVGQIWLEFYSERLGLSRDELARAGDAGSAAGPSAGPSAPRKRRAPAGEDAPGKGKAPAGAEREQAPAGRDASGKGKAPAGPAERGAPFACTLRARGVSPWSALPCRGPLSRCTRDASHLVCAPCWHAYELLADIAAGSPDVECPMCGDSPPGLMGRAWDTPAPGPEPALDLRSPSPGPLVECFSCLAEVDESDAVGCSGAVRHHCCKGCLPGSFATATFAGLAMACPMKPCPSTMGAQDLFRLVNADPSGAALEGLVQAINRQSRAPRVEGAEAIASALVGETPTDVIVTLGLHAASLRSPCCGNIRGPAEANDCLAIKCDAPGCGKWFCFWCYEHMAREGVAGREDNIHHHVRTCGRNRVPNSIHAQQREIDSHERQRVAKTVRAAVSQFSGTSAYAAAVAFLEDSLGISLAAAPPAGPQGGP